MWLAKSPLIVHDDGAMAVVPFEVLEYLSFKIGHVIYLQFIDNGSSSSLSEPGRRVKRNAAPRRDRRTGAASGLRDLNAQELADGMVDFTKITNR